MSDKSLSEVSETQFAKKHIKKNPKVQTAQPEDIDECPIQQQFFNLRLVSDMPENKQPAAFTTYLNKMYQEVKSHPTPAIRLVELKFIPLFATVHLQQHVEHAPVILLILNCAFAPGTMLSTIGEREKTAMFKLKQMVSEHDFMQAISIGFLDQLEEADDARQSLQAEQQVLKSLQTQLDQRRSGNQQTTEQKIELISQQQTPPPQVAHEHSEISDVGTPVMQFALVLDVPELKTAVAVSREKLTGLARRRYDCCSTMNQYLLFLKNALVINPAENKTLLKNTQEFQLQQVIDAIAEISTVFDELRQPIFQVYQAILIATDSPFIRDEQLTEQQITMVVEGKLYKPETAVKAKENVISQYQQPIAPPRLSRSSAVSISILKQVHGGQSDSVVPSYDYGLLRMKRPQRTNRFNVEYGVDGKAIHDGEDSDIGPKTIDVHQLALSFPHIQWAQQRSDQVEFYTQEFMKSKIIISIIKSMISEEQQEKLVDTLRTEWKTTSCSKYDAADGKKLLIGVKTEVLMSCTALIRYVKAKHIFSDEIMVLTQAALQTLDELYPILTGQVAEYKQYSYEFTYAKIAVFEFLNVQWQYIDMLNSQYQEKQNKQKLQIKTVLNQEKLLQNEKMVVTLKIDVQQAKQKINEVRGELQMTEKQLQLIKQQIQAFFEAFYSSNAILIIEHEMKQFELVRDYTAQSVQTFCRYWNIVLKIPTSLKLLEDENGLVPLKIQVVQYQSLDSTDDHLSEPSEVRSEISMNKTPELQAIPEEVETVEEKLSIYPMLYAMQHALNSHTADQLAQVTYHVVKSADGDRAYTLQLLAQVFIAIEQADASFRYLAVPFASLENLIVLEQMHECAALQRIAVKLSDAVAEFGRNEQRAAEFAAALLIAQPLQHRHILENLKAVYEQKLETVYKEEDKIIHNIKDVQITTVQQNENEPPKKIEHSDDLSSDAEDLPPALSLTQLVRFDPDEDEIVLKRFAALHIQYGEQIALNRLAEMLEYKFSKQELLARFEQLNVDRPWTEEEKELLRNEMGLEELCQKMRRTAAEVLRAKAKMRK